jgi:hypothetical protein
LFGYSLAARDGEIGSVHDVLFDDSTWTVRYFTVDTGPWKFGRRVLIPPQRVESPRSTERKLPVHLMRSEVESSLDETMDEPVGLQHRAACHLYYGWSVWLDGLGHFDRRQPAPHIGWNLRSARQMRGYSLAARDGTIGYVDDFLLLEESWELKYFVIATKRGWAPKRVLIPPEWIDAVSWTGREVRAAMSRSAVDESPVYDPAMTQSAR